MPIFSLQWERRLLVGSTAATLVGLLIHIIAIATSHWLTFVIPGGLYSNKTGRYLVAVQSGLWSSCKSEYVLKRSPTGETSKVYYETCLSHNMFPTDGELLDDRSLDFRLLDYMRTGSAFGIIALLVMVIGHLFAFYTLRRPRYVLKRLTALIHLMTAACLLVENEVFIRRVEYAETHLPERIPEGASHTFGYSFALSWVSFAFFLIAGICFLITSNKKKSDSLSETIDTGAMEDEPVAIRR